METKDFTLSNVLFKRELMIVNPSKGKQNWIAKMRSGVLCFGKILILEPVEISKFYIYKFIFFVASSNRIFTDLK